MQLCSCTKKLYKSIASSIDFESQAFDRKRLVKVLSSSGDQLGIADTWWQLQDILEKASDADVLVEESLFQLPTMLITKEVMGDVHAAIEEHREEVERIEKGEGRAAGDNTAEDGRREKVTRISKCIRMKTMDQHMNGKMNKVSVYLYKTLRHFGACLCFFATSLHQINLRRPLLAFRA